MKTKRGMTLFEIIIAIAILGIISVSFISAISNNLSMMFKTKDITEKLFDTQETVEDKMEKLREKNVEIRKAV
jgi:prepilin-type N-terminal cleavage/methylation domain